MVNLATLRQVGELLVDIHGQHDSQELMNPKSHLRLLDEFGDEAFDQIKNNYKLKFENFKNLRQQLNLRQKMSKNLLKELKFFNFRLKKLKRRKLILKKMNN